MANPDWHRDEIIIALDFYFDTDGGRVNKKGPEIIEISKLLKRLPLFPDKQYDEKFRNVNGVYLKLSNFKHFDPDYQGKGMDGGSDLDEKIFFEFYRNREKLKEIATEIKTVADDSNLKSMILSIEDDDHIRNDGVLEGVILYKLHKVRERDRSIVRDKKKSILLKTGRLSCEACLFEFESFYGEIGKGYIECHHRVPLSRFKVSTKTRMEDLALVCSNCHRMLHARIDTISVEDLKLMIKYDRL